MGADGNAAVESRAPQPERQVAGQEGSIQSPRFVHDPDVLVIPFGIRVNIGWVSGA